MRSRGVSLIPKEIGRHRGKKSDRFQPEGTAQALTHSPLMINIPPPPHHTCQIHQEHHRAKVVLPTAPNAARDSTKLRSCRGNPKAPLHHPQAFPCQASPGCDKEPGTVHIPLAQAPRPSCSCCFFQDNLPHKAEPWDLIKLQHIFQQFRAPAKSWGRGCAGRRADPALPWTFLS